MWEPPPTFPGGETLLANGSSLSVSDNHQRTLWLLDPSAWDPELLSSQEGRRSGSWLLVPFLLQPGCGAGGETKPGSPPRSLCVCGLWPSSHPLGKPNSLMLFPHRSLAWFKRSPNRPLNFFFFLSFITILLIWTCSLGFKVAWLRLLST